MKDKFKLQSEQYEFPYHYLVDLQSRDFGRTLDWGLDYLSYVAKVIDLVQEHVRDSLLDVGCGDGYLLYNLAQDRTFGNQVTAVGIDVDEKAIKFAQAFSHGLPVSFKVQDVSSFDESFNMITLVETLEHIPDDELGSFLTHIDRLLQSMGTLIISVPSDVRPVLEKHYRHYSLDMLKSYFPGYDVIDVHFVTDRGNVLYKIIARLLSDRRMNFNYGVFKRLLFKMHDRLTRDVTEDRGAHIVAAFRKP